MAILFHTEDLNFSISGSKRDIADWIRSSARNEGYEPGDLNVIFCSDDYLLGINRQYLEHDYLTDIITFDYTEDGKLSGDLFISVDRVRDNAEALNVVFHVELLRVIIHGIMHLAGYKDATEEERKVMRGKENQYLKIAPERLNRIK